MCAAAVSAAPCRQLPAMLGKEPTLQPHVVLKLVTPRPVLRYELSGFPKDLNALDDEVLEHLVLDGSSFELRCEGSLLTKERLDNYRTSGRTMVVHVLTHCSPAAGGGALRRLLVPGPAEGAEKEALSAAASDRTSKLEEEVEHLRSHLSALDGTVGGDDGRNILVDLINTVQGQLLSFLNVTRLVQKTGARGAAEVRHLVEALKRSAVADLALSLKQREALGHMHYVMAELASALFVGSQKEAKRWLQQLGALAEEVAECQERMGAYLEADPAMDTLLDQLAPWLQASRDLGCSLRDVRYSSERLASNLPELPQLGRPSRVALRDSLFEAAARVMSIEALLDEYLRYLTREALFPVAEGACLKLPNAPMPH